MKKYFYLPLLALALGVFGAANAQDFNTSSGYMSSGSAYSSTITEVGSTGIDYSAGQGIANRGRGDENFGGGAQDQNNDLGSPIGSSAVLLVFAAIATGVVAVRRRRLV